MENHLLGALSTAECERHMKAEFTRGDQRGHIKVLDRTRLEQMSCECYEVVRRETSRLLPSPLQ